MSLNINKWIIYCLFKANKYWFLIHIIKTKKSFCQVKKIKLVEKLQTLYLCPLRFLYIFVLVHKILAVSQNIRW